MLTENRSAAIATARRANPLLPLLAVIVLSFCCGCPFGRVCRTGRFRRALLLPTHLSDRCIFGAWQIAEPYLDFIDAPRDVMAVDANSFWKLALRSATARSVSAQANVELIAELGPDDEPDGGRLAHGFTPGVKSADAFLSANPRTTSRCQT